MLSFKFFLSYYLSFIITFLVLVVYVTYICTRLSTIFLFILYQQWWYVYSISVPVYLLYFCLQPCKLLLGGLQSEFGDSERLLQLHSVQKPIWFPFSMVFRNHYISCVSPVLADKELNIFRPVFIVYYKPPINLEMLFSVKIQELPNLS